MPFSIWLIELAEKLPSTAQLDGFDISSAQFPAREWLPKNVNLTNLDVLAPVPEHLIAKYDIVHIGLFVTVVQDDDPLPLLDNLLLMLSMLTSAVSLDFTLFESFNLLIL